MASMAELAAALTAANQSLQNIGTGVDGISAEVTKVGGETQTLQTQIVDLTSALGKQGNTTPEVDAALQLMQATLASLATRTQNLGAQVKAVDDLVPDVP